MPRERDMIVTTSPEELRQAVRAARLRGDSIGCVPTMGALHAGHLSLIDASRARCGFTVATIFVNPTQFAPHEDLSRYPRPLERDLQLCREAGADLVFLPNREAMYPPGFCTWVTVEGLSSKLEGTSRPTHFRGVTTIVMKLFQLVQPDVAFFGAKDYQQQLLIRRMTLDLDLPIEIVTCATVREPDGLAMSSRNVYLSATERQAALALSRELLATETRLHARLQTVGEAETSLRERLRGSPGIELDYAVIVDAETLEAPAADCRRVAALVAARVGTTRLIDNRVIEL
jgi:pantoate--beta-alanine ligase